MLIVLIDFAMMLWIIGLTRARSKSSDVPDFFIEDLRFLKELGFEAKYYRKMVNRQLRLNQQEVNNTEDSLKIFGFHCLIGQSAVLGTQIIWILNSGPVAENLLDAISLHVFAGIGQNMIFWCFIRLRPRNWFLNSTLSKAGLELCLAARNASACLPTQLELLHSIEESEWKFGRSLRHEKFVTIDDACSNRWRDQRTARRRWQSVQPIFEMLGICCGICPAFLTMAVSGNVF